MERIDEIGFGGLKLIQDTEMFCYGVDAVLLARFASRISHKKAADLGTNNGVIPILMSYMGGAEHITGAEMQELSLIHIFPQRCHSRYRLLFPSESQIARNT